MLQRGVDLASLDVSCFTDGLRCKFRCLKGHNIVRICVCAFACAQACVCMIGISAVIREHTHHLPTLSSQTQGCPTTFF